MGNSEYVINQNSIKRKEIAMLNKEPYKEAVNLPFWLSAYYREDWHLALYWKDYDILRGQVNNIQEANCIILWVIEGFRVVQSELFNIWIIE